MSVSPRVLGGTVAAAAVAIVLAAIAHFSPDRQVRIAQENLVRAIETRQWEDVRAMLDEKFEDAAGNDRDAAIAFAKPSLGQFLVLGISMKAVTVTRDGPGARLAASLRITGSGSPVAATIMHRVNSLDSPFLFSWQRVGWKPWEWRLISFAHPDLNMEEASWAF